MAHYLLQFLRFKTGERMNTGRKKKKMMKRARSKQERILNESLRELLGSGLLEAQNKIKRNEERIFFLKDAFTTRLLSN